MFKGILAIIAAFCLIKYRESIVRNVTGKIGWAEKYLGMGGSYRLMVILAVVLFIWGLASITGMTHILLGPLAKVAQPGV